MAESVPVLPPVEALNYFRRKGHAFGFAWQDVWQEEQVRSFTVAKAMSRDVVEDIRGAVDKAIAEGRTLEQFRRELRPLLEARGWWGRKAMTDPLTGETKEVQLGSPRRLKTIFDVNMRMAYQAGRWERMERNAAAFPYVRYISAGDGRVRPQHQSWHGTIRPIGDPWWDTHYPPCGWSCRCTAVPVNDRMMARRGWSVTERPAAFLPERYVNPRTGEVTQIEAGISPGFNYNVGKAYLDDLAARPLPPAPPTPPLSAQDLDEEDQEAIVDYTGMAHGPINRFLRGLADEGDDLAEAAPVIERLDGILAKARLAEAVTVYRRIDDDYATDLVEAGHGPGSLLRDKGFMSTSRSEKWAFEPSPTGRRRIVLKLVARAGLRALDIASISRYEEEAEILFARNTRLRVTRWDPAKGIFEAEVMQDDDAGSLLSSQE